MSMSRTRSNKAKNDKGSILADVKNLLYILHPAIQRMPKIERIEEMNALENKFAHLDHFLASFNSYSGLLKGRTDFGRLAQLKDLVHPDWWQWLDYDARRQCLTYLPKYSVNSRLNIKYHLKLKHHESRHYRTEKRSLQREENIGVAA